ncbi:hypothetical protein lerEdw1_011463, partial [Lerista edwardsae]
AGSGRGLPSPAGWPTADTPRQGPVQELSPSTRPSTAPGDPCAAPVPCVPDVPTCLRCRGWSSDSWSPCERTSPGAPLSWYLLRALSRASWRPLRLPAETGPERLPGLGGGGSGRHPSLVAWKSRGPGGCQGRGARPGRASSHREALVCQAEEVGLFRAVSEHLLQEGARPAPHQHLLGILAAHGTSRLLQVALGPCAPRTPAGDTQRRQEALAGPLMRILHNLAQVLQAQETGRPLALETPLVSLYVRRANSSAMGKMRLSFPGDPPAAASVVLPDQSAVGTLVPEGTPLHVQVGTWGCLEGGVAAGCCCRSGAAPMEGCQAVAEGQTRAPHSATGAWGT